MSRGRYGMGKPDANQAEIVDWLRGVPGVYVHLLSVYPAVLDFLVYTAWDGVLRWVEVKRPGEPLTEREQDIFNRCPRATWRVESIEDAARMIGLELRDGRAVLPLPRAN